MHFILSYPYDSFKAIIYNMNEDKNEKCKLLLM